MLWQDASDSPTSLRGRPDPVLGFPAEVLINFSQKGPPRIQSLFGAKGEARSMYVGHPPPFPSDGNLLRPYVCLGQMLEQE